MKFNFIFFVKNFTILFLVLLMFEGCTRKVKHCGKENLSEGIPSSIFKAATAAKDTLCNEKLSSKDFITNYFGSTAAESGEVNTYFFNGFDCSIQGSNNQNITFDIIDTISMVITSADQSIVPIIENIAVPKNSGTTFSYSCHHDLLLIPYGSSYTVKLIAHVSKNSFSGNIEMKSTLNQYIEYCILENSSMW